MTKVSVQVTSPGRRSDVFPVEEGAVLYLALKNILHYRGRTIVTFLLSFLSALLFIAYVALMDGSHEHSLRTALGVYNSALHVYERGYREQGGYDYLIEDVQSVESLLKRVAGIRAYAPRLETYVLLSMPSDSAGAMVVGIDPARERRISSIASALKQGRYLSEDDTNAIYMGEELALRLSCRVGDTVALIGTATDGSFAAENFKVVGLFRTGLFQFDSVAAFVNKPFFDTVMLSRDMASYIVVSVDDLDHMDRVKSCIERLLPGDLEVVPWTTLMHAQVQAMEVDSVFGYISMAVFFVVIFFVIMIFSFLNISGRTRELGMLRAIGLGPWDIFRLLYIEVLIIAVPAVSLAILTGVPVTWYFEVHPIVIKGIAETYRQYGIISDQLPMRCDLVTILWNGGVVFVINLLAVIYPVMLVNRLSPVEAMRHV